MQADSAGAAPTHRPWGANASTAHGCAARDTRQLLPALGCADLLVLSLLVFEAFFRKLHHARATGIRTRIILITYAIIHDDSYPYLGLFAPLFGIICTLQCTLECVCEHS